MYHDYIEPSADFAERTIAKIKTLEARVRRLRDFLFVSLAFLPLMVRELWMLMLVRRDYFSAASLPFGHYIVRVYKLFLSSAAIYALAMFAVMLIAFHALKNRRGMFQFRISM